MDVNTALRKIKRQFGDEYNVVINDSDIFDWIHDAELDIIRTTSDNDTKLNVPANNFPLRVPDQVNVKRLSINGKSLAPTSLTELDQTLRYVNTSGHSDYWYYQSGQLWLWPVPETNDRYNVEVLYSKTPQPMTVVAPYLQWQSNNSPLQAATVTSQNAWKNLPFYNIVIDFSIDSPGNHLFVYCGDYTNAGCHWAFGWSCSNGNLSLYTRVGNGTTITSPPFFPYKAGSYVAGTRMKLRILFNNILGTTQYFEIDDSGVETLIHTSPALGLYDINTTAPADLKFAPIEAAISGVHLYSFEMFDNISTPVATPIFTFNGQADLTYLPGIPLTPFNVTSGHSMSVTGSVQKGASNEFTVPEVYHEDIVKFCLARAHNKNQNWRAAEAEMEQYDRHVSTRRNEAQSTDQPQYKIGDPDDFQDEFWYA